MAYRKVVVQPKYNPTFSLGPFDMHFFSFSNQSTTGLESDVKKIAKQLAMKRSKDSLAAEYFYAVPHDPSIFGSESMYDGAEVYIDGRGYQFGFELDTSHSDAQVWKSLSTEKNINNNSLDIRKDNCEIALWYNRGKNSSYELMFKIHTRDLDSASKVKLLESEVPQVFSASSKDARIEIRLNDFSKIELEQWSKEEISKVLSESDWVSFTLAFPSINELKKVFDQRLVAGGNGSSHLHAVFERFPTQRELELWMKSFGAPGWIVIPGNYPAKFDFFSPPEDFPAIGIVRYPWASRGFSDDSYVYIDIVHRKNLPPLIEVMAFHLHNQKAAEKRARYLQKKLGSEFQQYEGDPWERFAV